MHLFGVVDRLECQLAAKRGPRFCSDGDFGARTVVKVVGRISSPQQAVGRQSRRPLASGSSGARPALKWEVPDQFLGILESGFVSETLVSG